MGDTSQALYLTFTFVKLRCIKLLRLVCREREGHPVQIHLAALDAGLSSRRPAGRSKVV